MALRRLYEKHLADSGLSDSSQEDDDVVADGHELDDISLNVQIPSTVGHNATEKAWHSAIANALRSDPDRIRKVRPRDTPFLHRRWPHGLNMIITVKVVRYCCVCLQVVALKSALVEEMDSNGRQNTF